VEAQQKRKWLREISKAVCQPELIVMEKPSQVPVPEAEKPRVRLRRVNCNYHVPYGPEGHEKCWWDRLKAALGTTSSDFVNATLVQIQNASRLPGGGISETGVNAVLAFVEGAEPKDEVEAALAIQLACLHAVTMSMLSNLGGACGGTRNTAMTASVVARLQKAFAAQVEVLRKLKHGGSQLVRVEHVHVNEGGQAVIGNVAPAKDK
jgi:hypothetical protein